MVATNNYTTNQPSDSFLLETQGYVQGLPLDDTVSRLWLNEGTLVSTATNPMWGGIPITEGINVTGTGADGLGPVVQLATSQTNCTGFSTYLQMMHGVITSGNNAPSYGPTNGVGFFRKNSQIRLAVACDPALITTITGSFNAINSQTLYWDVTNYRITLSSAGGNWALPTNILLLSVNTNSKIVVATALPALTWALGSAAIIQMA